jgi:hypothetical protein
MAQPLSKTGVPPVLQNVSVQYRNPQYVADQVFPLIDNCPPEAKIAKYLKGAWFRDEANQRGPGAEAARGGYPITYLDVVPQEYAFAKEVPDEDREVANAMGGPPLQPDQDAIAFATDKLLMKREIRLANLIRATVWSGVAATGEDAEGLWAAGAGNTFLVDVKTRIATILGNTGLKPNCLLLDFWTYMSLTEESTILDKIKYTERGVLTADLLAAILDLEQVIVASSVYSSAKELKTGLDFTAARIWDPAAATSSAHQGMGFLFYRPKSVGLKVPSAGYIARSGLFPGGIRVETWREDSKHQDVYEAAEKIDIVATGLDLGFQWKETLST